MKKHILYFVPVLCAGVLTTPVYAQKTPKQLGNILKKSTGELQSASNPLRLSEPLSFEESVALENRLVALTALSRTLRRNPHLPNSPQFNEYAQTLTLIGETLPTPPAPNASQQQKQLYANQVRQYINRRLKEEEEKLSSHLRTQDKFVSSLTSGQTNWLKRRHEQTLANAQNTQKWTFIQNAAQNNQEQISWGEKGWDEITLGPARLPTDPQDPLFSAKNTIYKLVHNPPQNFIAAMDVISYSPLTPYQKQVLWQHFAKLNDVLNYQLIYGYMKVFNKLPALKAPGLLETAYSHSMQQYARDTQLVLIEKLKKGEKWTEQQANAFFDLSVFLPENNGKDVISALTYLEPNAAFYLLAHPQENPLTHQLRAEIQAARKTATASDEILPKAPLKTKTGVWSSQRRLFALSNYYEVLQRRFSDIEKRLLIRKYQLQQASRQTIPANPTTRMEKLSYQLYCQLELRHLQELQGKIDSRIKQINTELLGLYETSGFK